MSNQGAGKFEVGTRVQVNEPCGEFYREGSKGAINHVTDGGSIWVDFDPSPGVLDMDGDRIWCVMKSALELDTSSGAKK